MIVLIIVSARALAVLFGGWPCGVGGVALQVLGNAMYHQAAAPVASPERLLLLAVIYRAVADANGAKNVLAADIESAWWFLESDVFIELCAFLGIRPSLRDDLLMRLHLSHALRQVSG